MSEANHYEEYIVGARHKIFLQMAEQEPRGIQGYIWKRRVYVLVAQLGTMLVQLGKLLERAALREEQIVVDI